MVCGKIGRNKLDDLEISVASLFNAKGLWNYVDGTAVLAGEATAEIREKFKSEQQKAFSIIVMSSLASQTFADPLPLRGGRKGSGQVL